MKVLELWDEDADPPAWTGASARLLSGGSIRYTGIGLQAIVSRLLVDQRPEKVFNRLDGWSNGRLSIRLKEL
jgi:hypothetical protein